MKNFERSNIRSHDSYGKVDRDDWTLLDDLWEECHNYVKLSFQPCSVNLHNMLITSYLALEQQQKLTHNIGEQ